MPEDATPPPTTAEPQRIEWIDVARGIGIVLVVYGHAMRGQIAAHLLPSTWTIQLEDNAIYAFHMPLFFLLSGLFAGKNLNRRRTAFLFGRLEAIVYPYFLWSILQTAMSVAASDFANKPGTWAQLKQIFWDPIGQFWFLYTLVICQLLLLLPRRAFYLMVPIGIILTFAFGDGNMVLRASGYLPFFALGVWLTAPGLTGWLASAKRARLAFLIGGSVYACLFLLTLRVSAGFPLFALRFAVAGAGIAATLGLARLIARHDKVLATLGRASMPIYLAHVVASAAVRTVLAKLHISAPIFSLLTVTAGGLFIPLALFEGAQRLGISRWAGFGAGRATSRRAVAVAGARLAS